MKDNNPFEDDTQQDLKAQHAELQKAYKKRDDEAKRLAEFIIALRKRPAGTHPELLLLTIAVLWGARLAWFADVEEWGTRAKTEGVSVTNGFLMIGGVLLAIWLVHEARVNGWIVIAKAAVLTVGLRIGLDEWMRGRTINGTVIAVGTLVAVSLPFLGRALQTAAHFAMDPLLFIRR